MQAFAVCSECCEVHRVGLPCPGCSGVPDAELAGQNRRRFEPEDPPVPRLGLGRPHLVGLAVGLAAAAGVLSIFGGM
jgi:hypothetical protein